MIGKRSDVWLNIDRKETPFCTDDRKITLSLCEVSLVYLIVKNACLPNVLLKNEN